MYVMDSGIGDNVDLLCYDSMNEMDSGIGEYLPPPGIFSTGQII
jgi:hypothetical protein